MLKGFTCSVVVSGTALVIGDGNYEAWQVRNNKQNKQRRTMVNQVILIGNLGAAPEQRQAVSGTAVTNFSVATSSRWKDADGQQQEETEWHRVVAFGRLAEICGQYLVKGSKIYIEGRLQTQQWEDKDGNRRYTTEIVARVMKMLDRKLERDDYRTITVPDKMEDVPF